MRVLMGEIIDVSNDLTTKQLTIKQKCQVLWQSLVEDSKMLGKRRKKDAEKLLKERNERIDNLRDGLLASLEYHLVMNGTLKESNEEADEVQLAIDRINKDILDEVLLSHEFHRFELYQIQLDADIVNSFGNQVPIVYSFKRKEV